MRVKLAPGLAPEPTEDIPRRLWQQGRRWATWHTPPDPTDSPWVIEGYWFRVREMATQIREGECSPR